jgi:hypothetical protein
MTLDDMLQKDYSESFHNEILKDIDNLLEHSWMEKSKLDNINKKIILAKANWITVVELEKLVSYYKILFFKKDISNKIKELNSWINKYSLDIENIEESYNELLKENNINKDELKIEMDNLYSEMGRLKLRSEIMDFINSWGRSTYSINYIYLELDKLKSSWIKVDDIEKLIFSFKE